MCLSSASAKRAQAALSNRLLLRNVLFSMLTLIVATEASQTALLGRVRETTDDGLSQLITALSPKLGLTTYDRRQSELNCIAAVVDPLYHHVLSSNFFRRLGTVPVYKLFISEAEDLTSPNYATLSSIRQARKRGCTAYLILLGNGLQLARFLQFVDRYRVIDTRARFLMLYDERLFTPDLHYLWKKIVNVVFIRQYGGSSLHADGVSFPWFELSTVPFPVPIHDVLVPRRLDIWRRGQFYNGADLFRDKTGDLKNETLSVVTFLHIPATYVPPTSSSSSAAAAAAAAASASADNATSVEDTAQFAGLEIEVMRALAAALNFQPRLYTPANAETERWGYVQVDGSMSGLLGEGASGRADLLLGDLHYAPHHLALLDLSVPYHTECLTFVTPQTTTDNTWNTLIAPFPGSMWLAVFLALLVSGVVFFTLARIHQYFEGPQAKGKPAEAHMKTGLHLFAGSFGSALMYAYSMLLLVSLPRIPSGWALRMLTGWWWLYCILVVVAYRASLTAILATPAPKLTIDTMEQLAASPLQVGGWDDHTKDFFSSSLDSAGQKIGRKFQLVTNATKAFQEVSHGSFAYYDNTYLLRSAASKYRSSSERNLHVMKDCVINMPISLGLQKNSALKPRVDRFLRRVIEAGLVYKWLSDVQLATTARNDEDERESIKALVDLRKLYGALVALGAGLALSVIALLGEAAYWRWTVLHRPGYDPYRSQR